ncbi:transketolase [Lentisphaera araneosa HTCC2155]|uniref:Transketolase n=1 Tax=Lentisphaera araneosa HTCC2155 TaxID=313628 RepID=A6DKI5_9BACT|nr:transketolase [Lentisphaera araneosa]EDM27883.1 transketolase [Lentisphaera araneosa HTCC2155]
MSQEKLQELSDHIAVLSAEGVQAANSGHPGMPMGCSDIGSILWSKHLKHNPADSNWFNRDRFVLSAGHGSMFIYSLLHLFGYDVSTDDLKNFRQLGAKTPGHPEFGHTDGVETTTGPLGAGISNAVGMALAAKIQGEKFNTAEHTVVDSNIYTVCGDGCLMEGVASEAASTAGHLGLDNLVLIYDSNSITIEGSTDLAFTEDVGMRFRAYGWEVIECNGNDLDAVDSALTLAKKSDKPVIIIATTIIGKGSPTKAGTHKVHGAPLGAEEVTAFRETLLGGEAFDVSDSVKAFCAETAAAGAEAQKAWEAEFAAWSQANPELRKEWDVYQNHELPAEFSFPEFPVGEKVASRKSSHAVLNSLAEQVPFLLGGSADLDCSNLTRLDAEGDINTGKFDGRNLHFGVREHGMGGIVNGMINFGGMRVYCSTFLVFSDYMRPTIRLAALMKTPAIYVFTHDSFFVGEDGPTHQPVEHKAALECIPGLTVLRPADANEVKAAWEVAIRKTDGPTALLMSRQNLTTLAETVDNDVAKGAYVAKAESGDSIDLILMASGSEVELAVAAAKNLEAEGKSVRVVSMPSSTLFEEQSAEYKESVLPGAVSSRFAIDYGSSISWYRYIGLQGASHCLDRFGECGPGGTVAEHFGYTTDALTAEVRDYLA